MNILSDKYTYELYFRISILKRLLLNKLWTELPWSQTHVKGTMQELYQLIKSSMLICLLSIEPKVGEVVGLEGDMHWRFALATRCRLGRWGMAAACAEDTVLDIDSLRNYRSNILVLCPCVYFDIVVWSIVPSNNAITQKRENKRLLCCLYS